MNADFKNKKSDYLLALALEEQLEQDAELKKYTSEHITFHQFSDEHNARMKKLFKIADRRELKTKRRRIFRQLAAGFILLICISAVTITQVEAFRLPIIRFFTEVKDNSTFFGRSNAAEQIITENFNEYEPQYVPNGFAVLSVNEDESTFRIDYVNEEKNLSYIYFFFEGTENVAIDTENGTTKEFQINDNPVYLIQEDDTIKLLMNKDGKQFYLNGKISYEDAVKIMESIK